MSLYRSSLRIGGSISIFRPQSLRLTSNLRIHGQPGTHPRRTFSSSMPLRAIIQPVFSPEAVHPIGPYSQAIKANGFVFLSGQLPADPQGNLTEGTAADKAHKMCQNAKTVLEAASSSLDKVVKVTIYFRNMDDFKEVNEVYAEYFPHKPARSASEATKLPLGASLEMDIIAVQ
ncbi:hypothetical protein CDV36_004082 [Fusarium kuroshium]|uniref:2-iminobutanoate/2-iminopropanoate deaminase n=1 Tax=Fusarium kuroshium TaxID=2010991 RepID=A0A3M2SFB7_9HYPO|nr:hypothetical protein CDV36_004082 [Fusarium kuroshium]